jgi:hypothetical protein
MPAVGARLNGCLLGVMMRELAAKGFNDLFEKTCPQGIRVDCYPGGGNQALTNEV